MLAFRVAGNAGAISSLTASPATCMLWRTVLTTWCRVLLEQLTGLQLVKKFSAFHWTRRFITALTSVRHLSLSWGSPIQSTYLHPTSWRSILILSTHLRLGLLHNFIIDVEGLHDLSSNDCGSLDANDGNQLKKTPEYITLLPLLQDKCETYFVNISTVQLVLYGGKRKLVGTCSTSESSSH